MQGSRKPSHQAGREYTVSRKAVKPRVRRVGEACREVVSGLFGMVDVAWGYWHSLQSPMGLSALQPPPPISQPPAPPSKPLLPPSAYLYQLRASLPVAANPLLRANPAETHFIGVWLPSCTTITRGTGKPSICCLPDPLPPALPLSTLEAHWGRGWGGEG